MWSILINPNLAILCGFLYLICLMGIIAKEDESSSEIFHNDHVKLQVLYTIKGLIHYAVIYISGCIILHLIKTQITWSLLPTLLCVAICVAIDRVTKKIHYSII